MNYSLESHKTIYGINQENWMFRVNKGGRISKSESLASYDQYHPYKLPDYDFQLVENGEGYLIIDGTRYHLLPQDVIFLSPGETFEVEYTNSDLIRYYIHFTPVALTENEKNFSLSSLFPSRHFRVPKFKEKTETLLVIMQELAVQDKSSRVQASSLFSSLMVDFRREVEAGMREKILGSGDKSVRNVIYARTYIEKNFAQSLTIATLASKYQMNRDYFSRLFRKLTGFTPYHYVIKCRIDQAKLELIEAKLPIKEIAESVGFSDVHHFTRAFRRWTGQTPALFSRSAKSSYLKQN